MKTSKLISEKRWWELYNKGVAPVEKDAKAKKKYEDEHTKKLWVADVPEINLELLLAICVKLEINPNPVLNTYRKTRKEFLA